MIATLVKVWRDGGRVWAAATVKRDGDPGRYEDGTPKPPRRRELLVSTPRLDEAGQQKGAARLRAELTAALRAERDRHLPPAAPAAVDVGAAQLELD